MNQWFPFILIILVSRLDAVNAQTPRLVSAIVVFGDSIVDMGNNNYLPTLFRADYLPYGRDFSHRTPTGRFCNGKLAIDFIAILLCRTGYSGHPEHKKVACDFVIGKPHLSGNAFYAPPDFVGFNNAYPLPYMNPRASGRQLLNGANFASAASGYDDQTSILNHAISLSQQIENYKDYRRKLVRIVGRERARAICNDTLFIIGAGSSDFVLNYYINPLTNLLETPVQYSSYLVDNFSKLVKDLYRLGARKIGVTSLPPIGCLPLVITLFGSGNPGCVAKMNADARVFNMRMNATTSRLRVHLPRLNIEVFDIYNPLYDLIQHPSDNGFAEAGRGCCGTGTIETSFLCNKNSVGTCTNATEYVFWDSVHPSEAANRFVANRLKAQGIKLIITDD